MTSLGNCIIRTRVPSPEPGAPLYLDLLPSNNQGHSDSSESDPSPVQRKASMRSRRDAMKQQFRDMMGGVTRKISSRKGGDDAKVAPSEPNLIDPSSEAINASTPTLANTNVDAFGGNATVNVKEVDDNSSNSDGKPASNGSSSRHSDALSVTRRIKNHLRRTMTFRDSDSKLSKKSQSSDESKRSSVDSRSSSDYDVDPTRQPEPKFLSPRKLSPDFWEDIFGFHNSSLPDAEHSARSWEEMKKKLEEEGVLPELIAEKIVQDKQIPFFFSGEGGDDGNTRQSTGIDVLNKIDMNAVVPETKRTHHPSAEVDAGLKMPKQRSPHNVKRVSDSPPIDAWSSEGSLEDIGLQAWPQRWPSDEEPKQVAAFQPPNTEFTMSLPLRPKIAPSPDKARERGSSNESRSSKFHEHFSPQNPTVLGAYPNGNWVLPRPEDIGVASTVDYRVSPKRTRRNVSGESAASPPKRRKSSSSLARQASRKSSGWTTIDERKDAADPNDLANFYSDCVMDPTMAMAIKSN